MVGSNAMMTILSSQVDQFARFRTPNMPILRGGRSSDCSARKQPELSRSPRRPGACAGTGDNERDARISLRRVRSIILEIRPCLVDCSGCSLAARCADRFNAIYLAFSQSTTLIDHRLFADASQPFQSKSRKSRSSIKSRSPISRSSPRKLSKFPKSAVSMAVPSPD